MSEHDDFEIGPEDLELKREIRDQAEYQALSAQSFDLQMWVWFNLISVAAKISSMKGLCALFISSLFGMFLPQLVGELLQAVVVRDLADVTRLFVFMTFVVFCQHCFQYIYDYYREYVFSIDAQTIDQQLNRYYFNKSAGQHVNLGHVLSSSNFEKGRASIFQTERHFLFLFIPTVFNMIISVLFTFSKSVEAGLFMLMILGFYLLVSRSVNPKILVEYGPIEAARRAQNRRRTEAWELVTLVKTLSMEVMEEKTLSDKLKVVCEKDLKLWLWCVMKFTVRGFFNSVGVIVSTGLVVYHIWLNECDVSLLLPIFFWSKLFTDNLWQLSNVELQMNVDQSSIQALKNALTLEPDITDVPDAHVLHPDAPLRVEFKDISYQYPTNTLNGTSGETPSVLCGVSFTIEPGEKVALIAESGGGKSTLMHLLRRDMDPTGGAVLIDGVNLKEVKQASWLGLVGDISQHAKPLSGTIRDALTYGLTRIVSDEELWAVMKRLKIDFGARLTNGLNTKIGKYGIQLSGGQVQRLMIGAAILRLPRVLLIDEATNALDAQTELQVQAGIAEALTPATSALIIAHRLSTVRTMCTKFVVLGPHPSGKGVHVEAVAKSFEELYDMSPTFRALSVYERDLHVKKSTVLNGKKEAMLPV